jgi:flagellar biosynthesis protein FlhF
MKIVRHTAREMRHALRAIREQLGEDAVILSSRRGPDGVEVTAAVDFDARRLEDIAPAETALPGGSADSAVDLRPSPAAAPSAEAMGHELKTLRRILETQLAQLAWNERSRRNPVHTELLCELAEIGVARDLADHLIGQLPAGIDLLQGRRFAVAGLSQYLQVTGDCWLENGGRVAFVGATGVGKTTVLAKLAVRWMLRHGPKDLALIASDTVRIGAQEQMHALGQLLGVPVHVPERFESLPQLLARLERYRLVLIDTPGTSVRDTQFEARLAVLAACGPALGPALVLAASTQAGALEQTLERFRPLKPASCVLTKTDEAASLGGALSALIRSRLPVSYVSDGQRVPEDLRPARALELITQAVRLAKTSGAAADEDLLRRRLGKPAHANT